ncbi:MAG: nitronate monooxygenase [Thermoanaerobaculia bacterium]
MNLPKIIQGGMGAGVSSWRLARVVSSLGQLGVVSGIALDVILARRLQHGDADGSVRRAIEHFPFREIAERVVAKYFVPGGKPKSQRYAMTPMHTLRGAPEVDELCMLGNFVEVFLAREGHDQPVGINYLEKIQLPLLPSIYGALLAGVAYVLIGAGIPIRIPGVLDRLSANQAATYELTVAGASAEDVPRLEFDPTRYFAGTTPPTIERPRFLAIISSNALATTMLKRSNGRVDGLIVETPTAGGHNAPPRGKPQLDVEGQPLYGDKDHVDLEKLRELGVPFWLAGGYATPEQLRNALTVGASGVQVGTAFAFCEESGLAPEYRNAVLTKAHDGVISVFTDPLASPTGFPFKVAQLDGSLSETALYESRKRICDLGYLRQAYRKADGLVGFRCPGEPADAYIAKGGVEADTIGRKCLCNALIANIGHPQQRDRGPELPLLTAGDDLHEISRFFRNGDASYSARDVVAHIVDGA